MNHYRTAEELFPADEDHQPIKKIKKVGSEIKEFDTDIEKMTNCTFVKFFEKYNYGSEFIEDFEPIAGFEHLHKCTIVRRDPFTDKIISQEPTIVLNMDAAPLPIKIPKEAWKYAFEVEKFEYMYSLPKDSTVKLIIFSWYTQQIMKGPATLLLFFCQDFVDFKKLEYRKFHYFNQFEEFKERWSHFVALDKSCFWTNTLHKNRGSEHMNISSILLFDKKKFDDFAVQLYLAGDLGYHPLFDYVDEFWCLENDDSIDDIIYHPDQKVFHKGDKFYWKPCITNEKMLNLHEDWKRSNRIQKSGITGEKYCVELCTNHFLAICERSLPTFEKFKQHDLYYFTDRFPTYMPVMNATNKYVLYSPTNLYRVRDIPTASPESLIRYYSQAEIVDFMDFYEKEFNFNIRIIENTNGLWLFEEISDDETYTPNHILVKNLSASDRGYQAGLQTYFDLFFNDYEHKLKFFVFSSRNDIRQEGSYLLRHHLMKWLYAHNSMQQTASKSVAMRNVWKINCDILIDNFLDNIYMNVNYLRSKLYDQNLQSYWKYNAEKDCYEKAKYARTLEEKLEFDEKYKDANGHVHPIIQHLELMRLEQDEPEKFQKLVEEYQEEQQENIFENQNDEDPELNDLWRDATEDDVLVDEWEGGREYITPDGAKKYEFDDPWEEVPYNEDLEEELREEGIIEDDFRPESNVFSVKQCSTQVPNNRKPLKIPQLKTANVFPQFKTANVFPVEGITKKNSEFAKKDKDDRIEELLKCVSLKISEKKPLSLTDADKKKVLTFLTRIDPHLNFCSHIHAEVMENTFLDQLPYSLFNIQRISPKNEQIQALQNSLQANMLFLKGIIDQNYVQNTIPDRSYAHIYSIHPDCVLSDKRITVLQDLEFIERNQLDEYAKLYFTDHQIIANNLLQEVKSKIQYPNIFDMRESETTKSEKEEFKIEKACKKFSDQIVYTHNQYRNSIKSIISPKDLLKDITGDKVEDIAGDKLKNIQEELEFCYELRSAGISSSNESSYNILNQVQKFIQAKNLSNKIKIIADSFNHALNQGLFFRLIYKNSYKHPFKEKHLEYLLKKEEDLIKNLDSTYKIDLINNPLIKNRIGILEKSLYQQTSAANLNNNELNLRKNIIYLRLLYLFKLIEQKKYNYASIKKEIDALDYSKSYPVLNSVLNSTSYDGLCYRIIVKRIDLINYLGNPKKEQIKEFKEELIHIKDNLPDISEIKSLEKIPPEIRNRLEAYIKREFSFLEAFFKKPRKTATVNFDEICDEIASINRDKDYFNYNITQKNNKTKLANKIKASYAMKYIGGQCIYISDYFLDKIKFDEICDSKNPDAITLFRFYMEIQYFLGRTSGLSGKHSTDLVKNISFELYKFLTGKFTPEQKPLSPEERYEQDYLLSKLYFFYRSHFYYVPLNCLDFLPLTPEEFKNLNDDEKKKYSRVITAYQKNENKVKNSGSLCPVELVIPPKIQEEIDEYIIKKANKQERIKDYFNFAFKRIFKRLIANRVYNTSLVLSNYVNNLKKNNPKVVKNLKDKDIYNFKNTADKKFAELSKMELYPEQIYEKSCEFFQKNFADFCLVCYDAKVSSSQIHYVSQEMNSGKDKQDKQKVNRNVMKNQMRGMRNFADTHKIEEGRKEEFQSILGTYSNRTNLTGKLKGLSRIIKNTLKDIDNPGLFNTIDLLEYKCLTGFLATEDSLEILTRILLPDAYQNAILIREILIDENSKVLDKIASFNSQYPTFLLGQFDFKESSEKDLILNAILKSYVIHYELKAAELAEEPSKKIFKNLRQYHTKFRKMLMAQEYYDGHNEPCLNIIYNFPGIIPNHKFLRAFKFFFNDLFISEDLSEDKNYKQDFDNEKKWIDNFSSNHKNFEYQVGEIFGVLSCIQIFEQEKFLSSADISEFILQVDAIWKNRAKNLPNIEVKKKKKKTKATKDGTTKKKDDEEDWISKNYEIMTKDIKDPFEILAEPLKDKINEILPNMNGDVPESPELETTEQKNEKDVMHSIYVGMQEGILGKVYSKQGHTSLQHIPVKSMLDGIIVDLNGNPLNVEELKDDHLYKQVFSQLRKSCSLINELDLNSLKQGKLNSSSTTPISPTRSTTPTISGIDKKINDLDEKIEKIKKKFDVYHQLTIPFNAEFEDLKSRMTSQRNILKHVKKLIKTGKDPKGNFNTALRTAVKKKFMSAKNKQAISQEKKNPPKLKQMISNELDITSNEIINYFSKLEEIIEKIHMDYRNELNSTVISELDTIKTISLLLEKLNDLKEPDQEKQKNFVRDHREQLFKIIRELRGVWEAMRKKQSFSLKDCYRSKANYEKQKNRIPPPDAKKDEKKDKKSQYNKEEYSTYLEILIDDLKNYELELLKTTRKWLNVPKEKESEKAEKNKSKSDESATKEVKIEVPTFQMRIKVPRVKKISKDKFSKYDSEKIKFKHKEKDGDKEEEYGYLLNYIMKKLLDNSVVINSIQILPPKYPSLHVLANINIKGPRKSIDLMPKLMKNFKPVEKTSSKEKDRNKDEDDGEKKSNGDMGVKTILGVDVNRLNSFRTLAFALITSTKKPAETDSETDSKIKYEYEYNFRDKQYSLSNKELLDRDRAILSRTYDTYREKKNQLNFIKNKLDVMMERTLYKPTPEEPYNTYAKKIEKNNWSFADKLMAPVKYQAEKRQHLKTHIKICQAKRDKYLKKTKSSDKRAEGHPKRFSDAKRNITQRKIDRLNREIYLLGQRQTHLRDWIKQYLIDVLTYMFITFEPKLFGYEILHLTADKKPGGLGEIVSSMFSNLDALLSIVERRIKNEGGNYPELAKVGAGYTSINCSVCHFEKKNHTITSNCILDNSMSYDYSPCLCCKDETEDKSGDKDKKEKKPKIYDRHISSAQNTAVLADKKAESRK